MKDLRDLSTGPAKPSARTPTPFNTIAFGRLNTQTIHREPTSMILRKPRPALVSAFRHVYRRHTAQARALLRMHPRTRDMRRRNRD